MAYQCTVCREQLPSKLMLDFHFNLLHSGLSYNIHCGLCSAPLPDPKALSEHIKIHATLANKVSEEDGNENESEDSFTSLKCGICCMRLRDHRLLVSHMQRHVIESRNLPDSAGNGSYDNGGNLKVKGLNTHWKTTRNQHEEPTTNVTMATVNDVSDTIDQQVERERTHSKEFSQDYGDESLKSMLSLKISNGDQEKLNLETNELDFQNNKVELLNPPETSYTISDSSSASQQSGNKSQQSGNEVSFHSVGGSPPPNTKNTKSLEPVGNEAEVDTHEHVMQGETYEEVKGRADDTQDVAEPDNNNVTDEDEEYDSEDEFQSDWVSTESDDTGGHDLDLDSDCNLDVNLIDEELSTDSKNGVSSFKSESYCEHNELSDNSIKEGNEYGIPETQIMEVELIKMEGNTGEETKKGEEIGNLCTSIRSTSSKNEGVFSEKNTLEVDDAIEEANETREYYLDDKIVDDSEDKNKESIQKVINNSIPSRDSARNSDEFLTDQMQNVEVMEGIQNFNNSTLSTSLSSSSSLSSTTTTRSCASEKCDNDKKQYSTPTTKNELHHEVNNNDTKADLSCKLKDMSNSIDARKDFDSETETGSDERESGSDRSEIERDESETGSDESETESNESQISSGENTTGSSKSKLHSSNECTSGSSESVTESENSKSDSVTGSESDTEEQYSKEYSPIKRAISSDDDFENIPPQKIKPRMNVTINTIVPSSQKTAKPKHKKRRHEEPKEEKSLVILGSERFYESGRMVYKCSTCDKRYDQRKNILSHLLHNHTESRSSEVEEIFKFKPFDTDNADYRIEGVTTGTIYGLIHYRCNICQIVIGAKRNILKHVRSHQQRRRTTELEIPGTERFHENGRLVYKCSTCDKCYSQRIDIFDHLYINHKESRSPEMEDFFKFIPLETENADLHIEGATTGTVYGILHYSCTICQYVLRTKYKKRFLNHLKSHNKGKTELELPGTERFHENGRLVYKCSNCGRCYHQRCQMFGHIFRNHKESRSPEIAELFKFKPLNTDDNDYHIIEGATAGTVCGLIHYKCTYCEYVCRGMKKCSNHVLCHTGGKLFVCDVCEATFTHENYLKKHKKRCNARMT